MSQTKSLIVGASGQVGTQMLGALGERALPTSRVVRDSWLVLDVAELAEAAQAAALLDAQELDAIYLSLIHISRSRRQGVSVV